MSIGAMKVYKLKLSIGAMKVYKLKLRNLHSCHTLGWSWNNLTLWTKLSFCFGGLITLFQLFHTRARFSGLNWLLFAAIRETSR